MDIFQRRHPGGQGNHEAMRDVTPPQGNADQSHSEVSPHTPQNGSYRKHEKHALARAWGKGPSCAAGGNAGQGSRWGKQQGRATKR